MIRSGGAWGVRSDLSIGNAGMSNNERVHGEATWRNWTRIRRKRWIGDRVLEDIRVEI